MKWLVPATILTCAALIFVLGQVRAGAGSVLVVGEPAAFSLKTLDGETIGPANPSGGVTVVEFWATWCGPCYESTAHTDALLRRYRESGVRVVGVSLDYDVQMQERFIRSRGYDWLHVNDYQQKRSIADAWGVNGVPAAFILSPTGELLWEGHPMLMDQPLADAVAKHPIVGAGG